MLFAAFLSFYHCWDFGASPYNTDSTFSFFSSDSPLSTQFKTLNTFIDAFLYISGFRLSFDWRPVVFLLPGSIEKLNDSCKEGYWLCILLFGKD